MAKRAIKKTVKSREKSVLFFDFGKYLMLEVLKVKIF
jgi:hypothetical protein